MLAASWSALALLATLTPVVAAQEDAPSDCALLHVATTSAEPTLRRVTVPEATSTSLPPPEVAIEALGYARRQHSAYGITSTGTFPFRTGNVVTLEREGTVHELGPLRHRAPLPGVWHGDIRAGAISGDEWYLVAGNRLYTVNIDPDSPDYLSVIDGTWLPPWLFPLTIGDIAVTPRQTLRTVTTNHHHEAMVVEIAIPNATIVSAEPVALPPASYGAIVLGPRGATYAIADNVSGHSRLYRIGAERSETVELSRGRPLRRNDAAGCLPSRPSPPPTSPPPPSKPSPPDPPPRETTPHTPPSNVPPSAGTPSPEPTSPPTGTTPTSPPGPSHPTTTPPPPEPSRGALPPPPNPRPVRELDTATKRQWVLATLLLIIGSGVVVRRLR